MARAHGSPVLSQRIRRNNSKRVRRFFAEAKKNGGTSLLSSGKGRSLTVAALLQQENEQQSRDREGAFMIGGAVEMRSRKVAPFFFSLVTSRKSFATLDCIQSS
jgi:hypothetical protein